GSGRPRASHRGPTAAPSSAVTARRASWHTAVMSFPAPARSRADVLAELAAAGRHDVRFRDGRLFSLVYGVDEEHARLLADAYGMYLATNGLGKGVLFQSLDRFEDEVTASVLGWLHAPDGAAGSFTSGGSESIVMGVRAAKQARKAAGTLPRDPEVVVPASAHPAFEKACELMELRLVRTPLRDDTTADVAAF